MLHLTNQSDIEIEVKIEIEVLDQIRVRESSAIIACRLDFPILIGRGRLCSVRKKKKTKKFRRLDPCGTRINAGIECPDLRTM